MFVEGVAKLIVAFRIRMRYRLYEGLLDIPRCLAMKCLV